ncbi:MAG: glycosyltransferase family 1 protein, partial [Acidobacteriaceae bacterium]
MLLYADLRWPSSTGIGRVQTALLARIPSWMQLVDLAVPGRIGSPCSPLRIDRAIAAHHARGAMFWSPGYMPPLTRRLPSIVTVHDLTHLHFYSPFHAAYYHTVMRRLYRRCDAVICVSEYTRKEFLAWSGMAADRVFTVYNGVSREFLQQNHREGPEFPYVLYPGNRRHYKNIDRLLDAYAQSKLPRDGIRLMLTGEPDAKLLRRALRKGAGGMLHFAGSASDEGIVGLYRNARMVAYVSLYEGFGLPILEGMAAGVPVMTSNRSSMPEIANSAALLVDPTSIDDIAFGLERLCYEEGLRANLIALGRVRAAGFDWDKSAARVWSIVGDVGMREFGGL